MTLLLAVTAAAGDATPEETIRLYLRALQAGDFKAAYPLVSRGMVGGKSEEDWVKEQQWIAQMAEVKIFEYRVYPGVIQGEKALVPNLLSSQDKFINQLGVPEHELYTLVREDGRWKVDQQQIVEPTDVRKWFPPPPAGADD
ncbi:MAG: hypothetical protein AB7V27_10365 [Candidatus Binatia bacterium]